MNEIYFESKESRDEGNYSSKLIAFKFPLKESSKMRIKKAGWPEFFIEDIVV